MTPASKKRRQYFDTTNRSGRARACCLAILGILLLVEAASLTGPLEPNPAAVAGPVTDSNTVWGDTRTQKGRVPNKTGARPRLPVPLTDGVLIFEAGPLDLGMIKVTNAAPGLSFESIEQHKFTGLESLRGRKSEHCGTIVPLADEDRDHYVIIEIYMAADNTDALIAGANLNSPKLFQSVTDLLSRKTIEQLDKPGARQLLRSEILTCCNQVLGSKVVQEIIITKLLYR